MCSSGMSIATPLGMVTPLITLVSVTILVVLVVETKQLKM